MSINKHISQSKLHIWLLAARPKTLAAAIAPVFIGLAMAYSDGSFRWPVALATLSCALLIQVGTNFVNDYCDFKKGTDNAERTGPARVTQSKLVTPAEIKTASFLAFGLALLIGLYLIRHGGWFIFLIGAAGILSGILYTAGPYPLGYLGLGELFVFPFFGPLAVAGTYYLQTQQLSPVVFLAGVAPGLLSMAILAVNNLRDIDSDRKTGKRTLAVRFGKLFSRIEYLLCFLLAGLCPLLIYYITKKHLFSLSAGLIIIIAFPLIRTVFSNKEGNGLVLNTVLADTGKLLLIYSVLFSGGWLL